MTHDVTCRLGRVVLRAVHALPERLKGRERANEGVRWPTVVDPHDKSGDDVPALTEEEWIAEKRRLWAEQVERWEASETQRAIKDGRHEDSSIEVSQATLNPRYNGNYEYDAASQSWRHEHDDSLSITFGYTSGEKSGSGTLLPEWRIGAVDGERLPYYLLSYSRSSEASGRTATHSTEAMTPLACDTCHPRRQRTRAHSTFGIAMALVGSWTACLFGCAMGTQTPLKKLQAEVPFTVVELRETAVGPHGGTRSAKVVRSSCTASLRVGGLDVFSVRERAGLR